MPDNTLSSFPLILKILAATIGAIFALTLTGDIDTEGKLKLSFGVAVKFTFSAFLGFVGGEYLINQFDYSLSVASQGFVMMMVSVFGMLIVGIIYQSIQMFHGKRLPEIMAEIKETFKAILK